MFAAEAMQAFLFLCRQHAICEGERQVFVEFDDRLLVRLRR